MFELVGWRAVETPSGLILQVGERSSEKSRERKIRARKIEKSQVRGDVKARAWDGGS